MWVMPIKKIYCYVDESGQDTKGRIFVVSLVVVDQDRDKILNLCEQSEKISGKRKDKWGEAKHKRRMRYLRYIFADDRFRECLRYVVFQRTRDYDTATIAAIASAINWKKPRCTRR